MFAAAGLGRYSVQEAVQKCRRACDVGKHRGGGTVAVARQDRHHDRLVLLVGVRDVARQQRNLVEQPVEPHPVLGHQRHQATAIRRPRRSPGAAANPAAGSRRQPPRARRSSSATTLPVRQRSVSGWPPSARRRLRGSPAAAAHRRSRPASRPVHHRCASAAVRPGTCRRIGRVAKPDSRHPTTI